jgi:hypothetical protein
MINFSAGPEKSINHWLSPLRLIWLVQGGSPMAIGFKENVSHLLGNAWAKKAIFMPEKRKKFLRSGPFEKFLKV